MRRHIVRGLYAVVAAGVALFTLGFAGPGSPAAGAARSTGPPQYTENWAGYSVGGGDWFRFIATTVTVPPVRGGSAAMIGLSHGQPVGEPFAELGVEQGGGAGSVGAHASPGGYGTLLLSPRVGDQLALSIYYDRHGHDYFTATDLTQNITRTVELTVGSVVYNHGFVVGVGGWPDFPPQADTRMLEFTGSHVTTYTGAHGTLTGPWATWQYITTIGGTAAGTVTASPSGLWNGGENFGVWLRALPLSYTGSRAAYQDIGGPFRFVATTLTVPPAQAPAANGGSAGVGLLAPLAPVQSHANISVWPGGGPSSVRYDSYNGTGTFTLSPQVGDQLAISVYYDQHGHYSFTATDTTQATTQTVTVNTLHPYSLREADLGASFDNQAVAPPPADTQLWQFTGSHVTTATGDHGSILGPWSTIWCIDTTDGTPTGAVVADATALSKGPNVGGQGFGVWLRHH